MTLETSHRGYAIRYGENSDEWYSSEAGDGMTAPTLSALKAKIDRMIAKQKKNTAVDFLVIMTESAYGGRRTVVTEAKGTAYGGPVLENKSIHSSVKEVKGHKIEAIYVGQQWGKSNAKAARRMIGLDMCCPIGPETDAAIAEANRLGEAVNEAEARHREAVKAIPRLTLDDISALVKISGLDPKGVL